MNIHTLSDLKKPKKAAKGKKTTLKGGVHTLADFKGQEGAKKQKFKVDDEEDEYVPKQALRDTDTDDDEDLLEEARKDYSGDEWEEEDDDGNITIHNSGAPDDDKVQRGVLGDARWEKAQSRRFVRYQRVLAKAKINATQSNAKEMDFSIKAGIGGGRYVWEEDDKFGTHTLTMVRSADGMFRPRYTLIKAVKEKGKGEGKRGAGKDDSSKAEGQRRSKRAKIADEED